ncbi:MAG: AI-2E family transporter [Polyangiaceae bacterium]|nr:AI-2E family transporter [Polyangiaceae bacterium]
MSLGRGSHAARTMAAAVVVAGGVKLASAMLAPFLLSLFIAAVTAPIVFYLRRRGFSDLLAISLAILVDVLLIVGVTLVVAGSMTTFYQRLPEYQSRANELLGDLTHFLAANGFQASAAIDEAFAPARMMSLVVDLLGALAAMASQSVIVILTVAFLLIEIAFIQPKLAAVLADQKDVKVLADAAREANTYLLVKTGVSIATGILAGLSCASFGLDFPLLWGLLAYLLNYIPNIGSFISAGPPILLALLTLGLGPALGITGAYLAIHIVIGNIIEPKITGDALGLSALVVFLSVIVWGFLLGPIGALLSAPLTLIVKHWLAHTDDWAFVATLLEPSGRVAQRALEPSPESPPG